MDGMDCMAKDIIHGGFRWADGKVAFAYWNSTNMITVKDYEGSISFELSGVKGSAKLIDPMDGSIYEIPPEVMEAENGIYKFKNMIIRDYPLIMGTTIVLSVLVVFMNLISDMLYRIADPRISV